MSDWDAEEHPRDDKGRFTTKSYKKIDIVERKNFEGIEVPKSEYAKIYNTLNQKFAGMRIVKGTMVYTYTAYYEYYVRVDGYNNYTPIMKWSLE